MDFSAQSTTHDDVDDRDATMMMRDDDDDDEEEEEEEEEDGDADPSNTDNVMEEPQPQPSGQQQPLPLTLGGSDVIKKPAFCLLDGMQDDDGGSRVTFPIYRLPATMGRTLENNVDKNFVGMGSHKVRRRMLLIIARICCCCRCRRRIAPHSHLIVALCSFYPDSTSKFNTSFPPQLEDADKFRAKCKSLAISFISILRIP